MELVDPKLGTEFNVKEALVMIKVALLCTNSSYIMRPSMSAVVGMLERRRGVEEPTVSDSDFSDIVDIERLLRGSGESGYDCSYEETAISSCTLSYHPDAESTSFSTAPDLFSISLK